MPGTARDDTHAVSIACNLCGSFDAEPIRHRDRHGAPLRSVICRRCGLVWTDPRPTPDEVREFYEHEYRLEYKRIWQPKPKHTYRAGKAALARFERLEAVLRPGIRLFDVGAGGGETVYVGRALGYQASGVEPNEGYAAYASKELRVPVTQGAYQETVVALESQDVVTMFHTVEHLEDPFGAMLAARCWLVPGGFLVVEVPNVEAVCQQPHQQFHRGHFYHFNLAALTHMGRRAGYEVTSSGASTDGGNIWATFRKIDETPPASGDLAGNYDRVRRILRAHTGLRHALSRFPYLRPLAKLSARFAEARDLPQRTSPGAILDALIVAVRRDRRPESRV